MMTSIYTTNLFLLIAFAMPIGDLRMLPNRPLPIFVTFLLRNLAPFVVTFSLWGVALSYGKHIKKLALVGVLVKLKLKLQMNVYVSSPAL
jgi:hypothetical protein